MSKKFLIISVVLFLLFVASYFFSTISPLTFPPTGIWTLPFIIISILPGFSAEILANMFWCTKNYGSMDIVIKCNDFLNFIAYFGFSVIYSTVPIIFGKIRAKKNLTS